MRELVTMNQKLNRERQLVDSHPAKEREGTREIGAHGGGGEAEALIECV
jgi:hypothetical protein